MGDASKEKKSVGNFITDFLMGGVAGMISKTVAAPLERVKLLLQTQHSNQQLVGKNYKSFTDCFIRVYQEQGLLSFWRGNMANIIRYFPTVSLNFAFKDLFKRHFSTYDHKVDPFNFIISNMLFGGFAGMGSTLVVHPLDFARTRMAADIGKVGQSQYRSLQHCLITIYRSDGLGGIYQGIGMSLFSIFLYRSMYFGFWDSAKRMIDDYSNKPFLYKFLLAQIITTGSETLNYPTDTVRRRMMMNSGRAVPIYPTTMSCIRTIYQEEGMVGFYKGCYSNAIRSVSSSLVLVLYDEFYKKFNAAKTK